MATIYDIAVLAKVSPATVSRALSRPDMVSEPTRQRIDAAAKQLGYAPNAAAKSLRTRRTGKILVTVPDIANPFFAQIIQGVEEVAQAAGYAVLLGDTQHQPEREENYARILLRQEADGLIFLGHRLPPTAQALVDALGSAAPVVNGCEFNPQLGVPSAHIDNAAAALTAMEHLYGLGHRRIGVVTGPLASPLSRQRLEGVEACARARGEQAGLCVESGDFSIESGIAAMERMLAVAGPPTAVFCFSDEMAIGVLDSCRRHRLRVPDEVSVVGFDDLRFSRYLTPALTTISQPMQDIGRETVRLLLGIFAGDTEASSIVTLPHRLVVRASTAPPKGAS